MSASRTDEPVLEETEFAGEISTNGQTAPLKFRVSAGADCRLRIDADLVDGPTYFLAIRSRSKRGEGNEEITLAGTSADGKTTVASDSVSVRGFYRDNGRRSLHFTSCECKVTLHLDRPVEKPVLRLWFRSFMSFSNPVIGTSLGRLMVSGDAENVGPDDLSGCVTLEAPSIYPVDDWRAKADEFLKHMHRGLALCHGGRLQAPRLDYAHRSTLEMIFFEGTGFTRELPLQDHLNQEPFIKALVERYLVERYERSGPLPDVLWTALGWMQTDTSFDETRFLSGMTALEAIVENQLPGRRGTIIARKEFKPVREKLEQFISAEETIPPEAKPSFLRNVAGLNRKDFFQKIHALFDHYQIPKRDFEGNIVRDLIKLRNDIVHRGAAPNGFDIWPSIVLVGELITRILLKEISFVGRYCCYVGGFNYRDFPSENQSTQK